MCPLDGCGWFDQFAVMASVWMGDHLEVMMVIFALLCCMAVLLATRKG